MGQPDNINYFTGAITVCHGNCEWCLYLMRQLGSAEACIIMANNSSDSPEDDDTANIMRVISVKNFRPSLRIIVQMLQPQSKVTVVCYYRENI